MTVKNDHINISEVFFHKKFDCMHSNVMEHICDIYGGIDSAYKNRQYVLAMLFYRYISSNVYSRNIVTIIPEGCSFYDLYIKRSEKGIAQLVNQALYKIKQSNKKLIDSIFDVVDFSSHDIIERNNGKTTTCMLFEVINSIDFGVNCNAFRYMVEWFAFEFGHHSRELHTSRAISELLVRVSKVKLGESIYDPACGNGGVLSEASRLTDGSASIYGMELNQESLSICQMGLIMNGTRPYVKKQYPDCIRYGMQFDHVISSPYYGLSDRLGEITSSCSPYFTSANPRCDSLFLQHMIDASKEGSGRVATIIPSSLLYDHRAREQWIDSKSLDAVILLPSRLFPTSNEAAAIVVFDRSRESDLPSMHRDAVFIDSSREYISDMGRCFITREHLERILHLYDHRVGSGDHSYVVPSQTRRRNY